MSNSQPDRLDRIEATLEQVTQALNNQATVNAQLHGSIDSLANNQAATNAELRGSIDSLANTQAATNAELRGSIDSLANTQAFLECRIAWQHLLVSKHSSLSRMPNCVATLTRWQTLKPFSNAELRSNINSLTNTVNSALDNQALLNAELRSSVNSLINTANQFQENFIVIVNEIRSMLRRIENLES